MLFLLSEARAEIQKKCGCFGLNEKLAFVINWVGGYRKWPVLLTFNTVFMVIRWMGGVQKEQKYMDG